MATISGVITDPQGGVIPQAIVAATDVQAGVRTPATTNSTRYYRIPNLPISAYRLTVEHSGFRQVIREGVLIVLNNGVSVNGLPISRTTRVILASCSINSMRRAACRCVALYRPHSVVFQQKGNRGWEGTRPIAGRDPRFTG